MNKPDEPLSLSAPLARSRAAQLCRKDPVTGKDCSWYHGLWQDLRAIGLAASPEHQAAFFLKAFRGLAARHRRLRLLISGAADYSILAHVLWACDEEKVEADVTVVDRCDTPLFLNSWYAERMGRPLAGVRAEILKFEPDAPFDVVCSHSFLGQFPPQPRTELVEKWAQLLAPGGTLLTVNRVRPGPPVELRFSPDEGRAFCATVEQRVRELRYGKSDTAEILERVRVYVQCGQTWSISGEELTALVQRSGFRIDDLSRVVSTNPQNRNISGKAVPKDAVHACVIASKP